MTEIQIPYLPSAQFFKILCRLGVNEPDVLGDSDSDPQIRTIGGTVSISAMVPRFRYTEADGRKRVVYTKNETYNIETTTGELIDADGNIGVNLLNTNSPQMDPQGWTYKATIRPNGGDPFDAFIPSNPEGGVYDLGDGLVFTPSTGITSLETRVKALEDAGGSGPGAPENFDESVQDIVGAMVAGAGGTYDDAAGTIVLPSGGGGTVSSVAGRTGIIVLSSADLTDAASLATDAELSSGLATKADAVHGHTSANIADWAEAVQDTVAAMLVSGANVTLAYDDDAGKVTVTAVGGDAEVMRDTIGAALVGVGGVSIAINDEADTITLSLSGVTSVQISDSTATGRSLLTAADAAAAREAIGAGTSDLELGTTGTTAAAGNRQASETSIGMVELATTAEATAGTDTQRAVTPAGLKAALDAHPAGGTDTEAVQDIVGAMVTGAGGTYDDGAGSITLPGGGGAAPDVVRLALAGTASMSYAVNSVVPIAWTLELEDAAGYHSDASNTRITVPAGKGGVFLLTGLIEIIGSGVTNSAVSMSLNGQIFADLAALPSGSTQQAFSATVRLSAGDYIVINIWTAAGSGLALKAQHSNFASVRATHVEFVRIGA